MLFANHRRKLLLCKIGSRMGSQYWGRVFRVFAGRTAQHRPAQTQIVRIPFVGCESDGQTKLVKAPNGQSKALRIPAEVAQSVAYYKSESSPRVVALAAGIASKRVVPTEQASMSVRNRSILLEQWKGLLWAFCPGFLLTPVTHLAGLLLQGQLQEYFLTTGNSFSAWLRKEQGPLHRSLMAHIRETKL